MDSRDHLLVYGYQSGSLHDSDVIYGEDMLTLVRLSQCKSKKVKVFFSPPAQEYNTLPDT
jgi:hypothetical protein